MNQFCKVLRTSLVLISFLSGFAYASSDKDVANNLIKAKQTYDSLTSKSWMIKKDTQAAQLNMLGALVEQNLLDRIKIILEAHGKLDAATAQQIRQTGRLLNQLFPANKDLPKDVAQAFYWVTGMYESQLLNSSINPKTGQKQTFISSPVRSELEKKHGVILNPYGSYYSARATHDAFFSRLKGVKNATSEQVKSFFDDEIAVLWRRMSPVIARIQAMSKEVKFADIKLIKKFYEKNLI